MNCKRCNGTGVEPDNKALGSSLRTERQAAGISLRSMADEINVSHSYLSQLESGQRTWRRSIQVKYRRVIQQNKQ